MGIRRDRKVPVKVIIMSQLSLPPLKKNIEESTMPMVERMNSKVKGSNESDLLILPTIPRRRKYAIPPIKDNVRI